MVWKNTKSFCACGKTILAVPTAGSSLAVCVKERHIDITVTSSLKASAQWWAAVCKMGYLVLFRKALKRSRFYVGLSTLNNIRWLHQSKHTSVLERAPNSRPLISNEIQHKGGCNRWLVEWGGFAWRLFSLEMLRGSSESWMVMEKVSRKRCVHSFSHNQREGCLAKLLSGILKKKQQSVPF